jgi:nucleoside-diphosphate-sugar epimerase
MGHEKIEIKVSEDRKRKLDIEVFRCDHSKLTKYTGWKPRISIDEGLKRTIDWYNSHGKRWSWEDFTEGTIIYKR